MEWCECLPLNLKLARKSGLVKTKSFNSQTVVSINQLFKVLSTGTNTCPQPWPPLINGVVDDALLEVSQNSYFKFLQGSVATLFKWSWKILSYFVANLYKTLHINFYQNRSSIVEVMIKNFWCFYASQCTSSTRVWWNSVHWFVICRANRRIHARTEAFTDGQPENIIPPPIPVAGDHKIKMSTSLYSAKSKIIRNM